MEIYLDNSATTALDIKVKETLMDLSESVYGNPSSLHRLGVNSEKRIKEARTQIARAIGVADKEIIFTSGGTESNNLAIQGVVKRRHLKGHIITSEIEHPSVLNTCKYLESEGYRVTYLAVDSEGNLNLDDLDNALCEETQLVSIMHINNETGTVNPIIKIGEMISAYNSKNQTQIVFHVDAVQSFGKIDIPVKKANIDLLSFSGHKIYSLKGTGGLYVKSGLQLKPLFHGGSQEKQMRVGTENLFGIVCMGVATQVAYAHYKENFDKASHLKKVFLQELSDLERVEINGSTDFPYIVNLSFRGVKGEVLLHSLESQKVYVSTGSACSSKKKAYSHVLESMGLDDERKDGAIRISFGKYNTEEDVIKAAKIIKDNVKMLRSIIKRR